METWKWILVLSANIFTVIGIPTIFVLSALYYHRKQQCKGKRKGTTDGAL